MQEKFRCPIYFAARIVNIDQYIIVVLVIQIDIETGACKRNGVFKCSLYRVAADDLLGDHRAHRPDRKEHGARRCNQRAARSPKHLRDDCRAPQAQGGEQKEVAR